MSTKALDYAENTLGVHEVYEQLLRHIEDLDVSTSDLDKALDRKRQLEEDYADAEVELISEKRGMHPEMSDTKFRTELKVWERQHEALNSIRVMLNAIKSEIQGLEFDQSMLKARIQVGSARLAELGGYLHYLAEVKASANYKVLGKTILDGVEKNQAEKTDETTGEK
jgi:hypothetical protein